MWSERTPKRKRCFCWDCRDRSCTWVVLNWVRILTPLSWQLDRQRSHQPKSTDFWKGCLFFQSCSRFWSRCFTHWSCRSWLHCCLLMDIWYWLLGLFSRTVTSQIGLSSCIPTFDFSAWPRLLSHWGLCRRRGGWGTKFLNKLASTFAVFYTTSTVWVSFFFVIIFELVYQWGYQDTNIASGQNANDKVKDDSLIADFFGVGDVHIDVELFHQILPLFGSVL